MDTVPRNLSLDRVGRTCLDRTKKNVVYQRKGARKRNVFHSDEARAHRVLSLLRKPVLPEKEKVSQRLFNTHPYRQI